ncbi:hypothetical protein [Nitrosococcus oceani]|uniref:hypothetical protein n=1 Tax=Nitrosococcus oceani TaxID=1229 RepID=UPI0011BFBCEF|nr:hypothetical protein [Nitrosococcus oceani]
MQIGGQRIVANATHIVLLTGLSDRINVAGLNHELVGVPGALNAGDRVLGFGRIINTVQISDVLFDGSQLRGHFLSRLSSLAVPSVPGKPRDAMPHDVSSPTTCLATLCAVKAVNWDMADEFIVCAHKASGFTSSNSAAANIP